jgi:nitrate/nitrite transport system substrate-binding protein
MKRRHFLKYTTVGTASFAFAACTQQSQRQNNEPTLTEIDLEQPEKANITLGYVPMADAAPLIVAKEKGFFSRQGLTVNLSKQTSWSSIETGLLEWRFDAAHAPYGMPMQAQLGPKEASMVALMALNLNGSAIALSPKLWQADLRPSFYYANFQEFSNYYRDYFRKLQQPPNFFTDSSVAIDTYLLRYWLAAMGILPDEEVKIAELSPSQLIYKLQAGNIYGYCVGEPWSQNAVEKKAGFVAYTSRDIWKGHPGKILATMQGWADKNPKTARALVASLIEACQFCDRPKNHAEIAQILSQSQYLNLNSAIVAPALGGNYNYSQLAEENSIAPIPDLTVFHDKKTDYLKKPNHANYLWRSHAVWFLTQMIRWNQIGLKEYPKDADKILDKIYPVKIYEEVAKAMKIYVPGDRMKKESTTAFIDGRDFDPAQPVAYLNQFELRA